MLFVTLLPPSRRFEPEQGLSLRHLAHAFAAHFSDPGLLALFGVGFLIMGALVATYNYLSYRLLEPPFGLSQAVSGAIFLVYLVGAPASAWFGRLGGRHGRARMMALALGLMLLGLLLTATGSLVVTIAGITVLTCGFFGAHSIASGWVSRRADRRARAGRLALPLLLLRRLQPVRLARRPVLVALRLVGDRRHGEPADRDGRSAWPGGCTAWKHAKRPPWRRRDAPLDRSACLTCCGRDANSRPMTMRGQFR